MHPKITHISNPAKPLQGEAVFAVLGLIVLSFAAHLNALSNTFVFDDIYVISGNYFIRVISLLLSFTFLSDSGGFTTLSSPASLIHRKIFGLISLPCSRCWHLTSSFSFFP